MSAPQEEQGQQPEQEVEAHEAWQYWGYLFKPDKTGTDKLKGLLSGLKNVMNEHSDSSDPDLTPKQLAQFYRELHGNYDQLFLETPSESIAFIYKSLGCLHSLQPEEPKEGTAQSTAFADPTVPALKTEGWIMWQTIQLLLGPEEHSGFLMEAVQKWDVKDPTTGEMFPKTLPRRCFPEQPDKHMVAWYEGVSERLRREAVEEERQREIEAHQAEVRRIQYRGRDDEEEGSVDSKGLARAYFSNPLYRHGDGRPSIVRRNSKRPALSPRPTGVMGKGKEAATTAGHVIRNIASPHLWDGSTPSKSHSRERDRDRRRRSLPENRYRAEEPPTSAGYDSNFSPGREGHHHHRHSSGQQDRPSTSSTDDTWTSEDDAPDHSHRHHHRDDPELRHSRSHEPTPSQKEYGDYFQGYDDPSRQTSSHDNGGDTPLSPNGIGPQFGPSASPLFASHIARQPQPQPRIPPPTNQYGSPRPNPSVRRAHERPYSLSPDPSLRPHDRDRDDRRYSSRSRERRHRDQSPGRSYADSHPPSRPGFPPVGDRPPPGGYPSRDRERRSGDGRRSGSDLSAYSAAEDQRPPRPKQTRFAAGVDGRVYPSEGPWR